MDATPCGMLTYVNKHRTTGYGAVGRFTEFVHPIGDQAMHVAVRLQRAVDDQHVRSMRVSSMRPQGFMRAFSVALKMETDVLLIDEVLSVGDAHFREKSEAALTEKIQSGQTVVLVSHTPTQVVRLCDRAVWIEQGRIMFAGSPSDAVNEYHLACGTGQHARGSM